MKNLNITPLTQNLFTQGCQFQVLAAEERRQLFVTEYLENTHFCLINYQFACEYGRDLFINVSRIIFSGPDYFVFEYKVPGKQNSFSAITINSNLSVIQNILINYLNN